jgi:hypothetical protein
MAKRIIQSPGVEINERDLSLRVPTPAGTTVYTTGFADQGPTDEVVGISSLTEFERIYGTPKSASERYFYHTVKAVLDSQSRLLVNRLPYGDGSGAGFGSNIGVLVYPVVGVSGDASNITLLSGFNVAQNFDASLRAQALSGAAFTIRLSNGAQKTINFAVDGVAPVRGGDARASLPTSSNTFTVPVDTSTQTTLAGIAAQITNFVGASANSIAAGNLTVSVNGTASVLTLSAQIASTFSSATSASVVPGLEDAGDVFTSTTVSTASSVTTGEITSDMSITQGSFYIGTPTQFNITQAEYLQIMNGQCFTWSQSARGQFNALTELGNSAIIVINKGQTVIDGRFGGYYLGLADNTNINPASDYDAIRSVFTVTQSAQSTGLKPTSLISVPTTRLDFSLSATPANGNNPAQDSISQIMEEKITGYDTGGRSFDDTLNLGLFKLRQSVFSNDANTLGVFLEEGFNGSIGYYRQRNDPRGGEPVNFFLENVENDSRNIDILVNPYLSDQFAGIQLNDDGTPKLKVRVVSQQLKNGLTSGAVTPAVAGCSLAQFNTIASQIGYADSLFPLGAYGEAKLSAKAIGNVPGKLQRALDRIRNSDIFDIDIIAEGGLGSIWTYTDTSGSNYFDDTKTTADIEALRTSNELVNTNARDAYYAIFTKFATFAGPIKDGGRGDLVFIADPLRQLLVAGKESKVINDPDKNFSTDIYWALRHQFSLANTSYATVYANYFKVYDDYSGLYVYVPSSGFAAAKMVSTDADIGPWGAPAGFNRGIVTNALDVAFVPNQRQRDDLYSISLNPITTFPDQGIVVFGQKTLLKKPSAFDRINVRRNFLYLEKATKSVMKFFIFENNTLFTRTQVLNTLTPFFDTVKVADGLYDYLIVCDERNNTPEVIDNNELVVDIYLKPVRTAEFIRVNFYATRTDANFQELVGG